MFMHRQTLGRDRPLLPLLGHRWLASELAGLMDVADLDRVASGPASEQVSLRGTLLAFGGAPAPGHGRKASIGRPVFHLAGRQPVDIEFDTKAGAAPPAADLAGTGLERCHQGSLPA